MDLLSDIGFTEYRSKLHLMFLKIGLVILLLFTIPKTARNQKVVVIEHNLQTKDTSFEEKLRAYIALLKLEHPEIVLAQAKLESANFTSSLYKRGNNLFGMGVAKQRETTAKPLAGSRYARYDSWEDSVLDYKHLQDKYYKGLTKDQYLSKLSKVYAEDPRYVFKLKKITENQLYNLKM